MNATDPKPSITPARRAAPGGERGANWRARQESIIDTSAALFARRGYHGTGVVDLCAANGLGKGALYHYIGSKEDLLAAVHDRVMDEVIQGADRVAATASPPSRHLALLGAELLSVIDRYPDHVWVFMHDFRALTGERAERFRRYRRVVEQQVEGIIQAGIDAGSFRPTDTRIAAMAWLGLHTSALTLLRSDRAATSEAADRLAELFVRGIQPASRS